METLTLEIPDDLKIRYLERRRKDVVSFSEAIATGDFATLERMGHQIKGNALSFGFPELQDIGRDIEDLALKKNKSELEKQLVVFTDWVRSQP
jgi:HPt (histidine-containing phosphotransfer) domain-containing protein